MRRATSSARRRASPDDQQIGGEVVMKKPARKQVEEVVEGPAVIGGDHVRDRVLGPRAGAKKGLSPLSVTGKEVRPGDLPCKERCNSAAATRQDGRHALD